MKPLKDFIDPRTLETLILSALAEDVRHGDATVEATIPQESWSTSHLVAKEEGVVAGLEVFCLVFTRLNRETQCTLHIQDGQRVHPGDRVATLTGPSRALLTGERTALNFIGRLSGIASMASRYAALTEGKKLTVIDTRKTTPGLRLLEKYAVQAGGCGNHRIGLFDMIMLKENHIRTAGSIKDAVALCRSKKPGIPVEVETTNCDEVREAVEAGADRIMFDNMDNETITEALKIVAGRSETEASGNMNTARIQELADSGLDFISVGALTHSVRSLDLSLLFEHNRS